MFMSSVRMAIFCYSASGLRRTEVDRGVPKMWMMALHWLTDRTFLLHTFSWHALLVRATVLH
ncbi:hypothetical protein CABS01_14283 [Colletotrichum abscissum]|uniref:uncharacterized protein n=1 Tax=Colletotrichum abscissum TaxID=1671311 RepID=UPI0027D72EE9|nr:uncharacterized protein CABS01_14283 [Colletotrichum abscissum]KAK1481195.1 hypothetical protein CABS01_14283 [Colletotrichum abscissum]